MSTVLPGLNKAPGELIDLGDKITGFVDPILNYLNTTANPSAAELLTIAVGAASNVGGTLLSPSAAGGALLGADRLVFDLSLAFDRTLTVPLDLGTNALGAKVAAGADVAVDVEADFDLSFGVDLSAGLTTPQRFFITPGSLTLSADVNAGNITATVDVGLLQASVVNGSAVVDTNFAVQLTDPNSDGRITLAELQARRSPASSRCRRRPRRSPSCCRCRRRSTPSARAQLLRFRTPTCSTPRRPPLRSPGRPPVSCRTSRT